MAPVRSNNLAIKIRHHVSRKLIIIGLLFLIIVLVTSLNMKANIKNQGYSIQLLSVIDISAFANPSKKVISVIGKSRAELELPEQGSQIKPDIINPYEETLPDQVFEPELIIVPNDVTQQEKSEPVLVDPALKNTWRKNAVQLSEMPIGPKIAIVIDDAGLDKKRTAAVIGLTAPVTISFLTYGEGLPEQARLARKAGHEIMVHMAMEPLNKSIDPGPNVLLTESSANKTLERLRWGLERFDGYVGINNHMGSLFTSDTVGMEVVMQELKRRGLLFLDSRTSVKTVGASIALAYNVPFTQRNIFLDNEATVPAINKQLRIMELFAIRNGYVVAIAHPRDATIQALSQWLAVIAERGFVQVPISTIVAKQQGLSPINLGNLAY